MYIIHFLSNLNRSEFMKIIQLQILRNNPILIVKIIKPTVKVYLSVHTKRAHVEITGGGQPFFCFFCFFCLGRSRFLKKQKKQKKHKKQKKQKIIKTKKDTKTKKKCKKT